MAGAAAVGFFTAASTTTSVVFAPLLRARAIALPRLREHAVTAGWALITGFLFAAFSDCKAGS